MTERWDRRHFRDQVDNAIAPGDELFLRAVRAPMETIAVAMPTVPTVATDVVMEEGKVPMSSLNALATDQDLRAYDEDDDTIIRPEDYE